MSYFRLKKKCASVQIFEPKTSSFDMYILNMSLIDISVCTKTIHVTIGFCHSLKMKSVEGAGQ